MQKIVDNLTNEDEISFTKEEISSSKQEGKNDLSEFGVEPDTPDLFNNESESLDQNELLSSDKDDDQEDDLEIPAFLRRQKINGLQKNKWKPP